MKINLRRNTYMLSAGAIGLVLVFMALGCAKPLEYSITMGNPNGLQSGDRVIMNDVAIGAVAAVELESPSEVVVKIHLDKQYSGFLKTSAVFTWEDDNDIADRRCLICKNCDEMSPVAEPGHIFKGSNLLAYTLACIGQNSNKVWMSFMRDLLEKSVESGEEFSQEALEKIETFARTNGDAFAKMMHEFNDLVEQLDEDARKSLEELLKSVQ